jgi:large subunit ribosomal protein L17
MLSNLVASLILQGSIETTVTRAKEVRRVAERIITRAKGGTLNDRRIVISRMNYKEAVIKLFDEVAPRYADRPGGYTRIVRTRFRTGDAAPMAVISLVD